MKFELCNGIRLCLQGAVHVTSGGHQVQHRCVPQHLLLMLLLLLLLLLLLSNATHHAGYTREP